MGAAFLITLREGLEIAIVLAILISYLIKTGRSERVKAVWQGAGLAVVLCLIAGVIINVTVDGLHGSVEKGVEAGIALAAASVLTWMIFWMREHARTMGAHLRSQVDTAAGVGALVIVAFVAVLREGLETVLFLLSAETSSSSGSEVVLGGVLGLVIAVALGIVFYRTGHRLNLRRFFNITGILLILFAAGLVGKFFHEFREMLEIETGWIWQPVWTVESGLWAKGSFYDFMKGFFGWHAETERIRLLAYFAYLIPVTWLFLKGGSPNSESTTPVAPKAEVTEELAKSSH